MKRMLMLASVASMIDQFNMSNIELLQEMGYEVHVACNFEKGSTCTDEKVLELKKKLKQLHVRFFQIDFERNVMKLNQDLKAYKQVLKLARKYHYTFIHCHSPIGGVVEEWWDIRRIRRLFIQRMGSIFTKEHRC